MLGNFGTEFLRNEDNLCLRSELAYLAGRVDPAELGQADIEQHQVRLKLPRHLNCFQPVRCLRDYLNFGSVTEHRTHKSAEGFEVIHYKNADRHVLTSSDDEGWSGITCRWGSYLVMRYQTTERLPNRAPGGGR
jgi:hypothetical protein